MASAVLFTPNRFPKYKGEEKLCDKTALKLMFSYGLCEGLGTMLLLNNMCRYQKNYGKTFCPWFLILTMKILALAICDTRQKNPIFRYFALSSRPSN